MIRNNPQFWEFIDKLLANKELIIDRPKGTSHPKHDFLYEVDYGYIKDTSSMDDSGIDVWSGTGKSRTVDCIICTIDLIKMDSEIKLLLGCTEEEKEIIYNFHNNGKYMRGILINR